MTDTFAVHIGGGLYLDSGGRLVFGPPSGAQVYQAPRGLMLDTKSFQDTFKDLSGILPGKDDTEKWVGYGVPRDVVNFLTSLQGTVKVVGTAVSLYFWAIGAALAIMDLMSDEDAGLSPELAKALYGIKSQLTGAEEIARADSMIKMHAETDGRIDRVQGLLRRLVVEQPTGPARAAIFGQMRDIVDELSVPLAQIRNQEWATTFNADANKGRGFASYRLFAPRSDGTMPNVPMLPVGNTRLDYRLGVPMLAFTATTYASLLRVAMPWFRSSGMYVSQLRKTADAIDRFIVRTQDECLARTAWTADTVFAEQYWSVFQVPTAGGPRPGRPGFPYPLAVGAFDLVRYDDAFLMQKFVENFQAGRPWGPRGLFDYEWPTQQGASFEDIAAAANVQAEGDYTALQVTTGLLHLTGVARMLRFLSTPPRRSETVDGRSRESRVLVREEPTVATSPSIRGVGVISADATLKTYRAGATVRIQTQEAGYVPQFRYRVVLRTLRHMAGNVGGWHELDYVGDVWSADYEPTAGDPDNNRLRAEFRDNWVSGEVVLHTGSAPAQGEHVTGSTTFTAATFDWYLPVGSSFSKLHLKDDDLVFVGTGTSGRATGGVSPHLATDGLQTLLEHDAAVGALLGTLGGVRATEPPTRVTPVAPGAPVRGLVLPAFDDVFDSTVGISYSMLEAERRHVREEQVTLDWTLDWQGGDLTVQLSGRPDQRPFRAYVVVEEVVYSGESVSDDLTSVPAEGDLTEVLHTPFPVELVNQLVLVPRAFFDEEHKAIVESMKQWIDFLRRYAEQRVPGPPEPIEIDPESAVTLAGSASTAAIVAGLDARARFAERVAPELWNAQRRTGY